MKVINVELTVKEDMKDQYEQFIADLVKGSRAESGNLSYNHFKKIGANNEYEIIEHWKDADAVEFHNNTDHFQKFLNGINDFLSDELVIIRMDYNE